MSNWRDDKIRELLSVRADAEIVRQIQGTERDSVVYDQITNRLHDRGVIRAKAQVNSKLKALKRQYHQVIDHNGRSGNDRKTWCYFRLCEAIWGPSHSTNPVGLVGSMETASASRSQERRFPPRVALRRHLPRVSPRRHTATLKKRLTMLAGLVTTVKLMLFLLLLLESLCRSPPKKKRRRNQTRSERLSAEMRGLFSEIDKDFNEREQLWLLEQQEYKERVWREARVEKAQEMAVLPDMTSLL
ncbi:uncharacterized protein LOC135257910 [Anguilla rostrata]|uniref:uncharacterized protein LOC135257910 n=1 Tax=Anguilla rostrata TaxID=7938 RepID=UPI0030CE32DD